MLRRWRSGRGSTAVEFAILLPVLLMFVLGVMDFGRLLWTYTTLAHAVQAAARCAAVNTTVCATTAEIQSYGVSQAWGLTIAPTFTQVASASCGQEWVATTPFTFVIPWFYGSAPYGAANAMTLTTMACYPG